MYTILYRYNYVQMMCIYHNTKNLTWPVMVYLPPSWQRMARCSMTPSSTPSTGNLGNNNTSVMTQFNMFLDKIEIKHDDLIRKVCSFVHLCRLCITVFVCVGLAWHSECIVLFLGRSKRRKNEAVHWMIAVTLLSPVSSLLCTICTNTPLAGQQ